MRLGLYSISLPHLTPSQAVGAIRDAGYEGVEWRVAEPPHPESTIEPDLFNNNRCSIAPTPEAVAEAARLCAEHGLAVVGLGTYIDPGDVTAVTVSMSLAEAAGAPWIRLRSPWRSDTEYQDAFEQGTEFLSAVTELARRHRVRALVELHQRTITPSASLAAQLVSGFDPEWIGVIYDVGNLMIEGYEDHRTALQLLGPHLAHVHLKNVAFDRPEGGGVWTARWAPMDDGVVDVPQFLEVLADTGYDGWVSVEEFSTHRPPEDALVFNAQFVRRSGRFTRPSDAGAPSP